MRGISHCASSQVGMKPLAKVLDLKISVFILRIDLLNHNPLCSSVINITANYGTMQLRKSNMKPVLTLKSIKRHSGLSQETHAYTATVYVNGKKWGTVSNSGTGGPDDFHANTGGFNAVRELEDLVKETYPKQWVGSKYFPEGVDATLEILCQELLEDSLFEKQWKGRLATQITVIDDGEVYTWPRRFAPNEENLKTVQEKHPKATILNGLPKAEALKLLRNANS